MPSLRHLGGKMTSLLSPTRRLDKHRNEPPNARIIKTFPPRFILDIPDDGAVSPTMTSFPQFARLPLELRQLIWSFGVSPRVVPVSVVREYNNLAYGMPPEERSCVEPDDWLLKCHVPPPATLFVCKESRAVAETQYSKWSTGYSDLPKHTTWLDADRDILDLGESIKMVFPSAMLRNVQIVRVYQSSELEFLRTVSFMNLLSKHFSNIYGNVREIQVVLPHGTKTWPGLDISCPGLDRLERIWLIDRDTGHKTAYNPPWMQPQAISSELEAVSAL